MSDGVEVPGVLVTPSARPDATWPGPSTASNLSTATVLHTNACPATAYLARLAPTGRRSQASALNIIAGLVSGGTADARTLAWQHLRYEHTSVVRAELAVRYAPATANRFLAALRGTLREAWRLGLLDSEQLARAVDLAPVRGQRLPAGRALTAGEIAGLFAACGGDVAGVRDAALLALLYGAGLRRGEAVALVPGDLDLDRAGVTVRAGKGAKDRQTYLPAGGVAAVRSWLELRGAGPGPLFWPVRRGGHLVPGRSISGQAVHDILRRRAAAAGVAAFSPHDLRRSMLGDLMDRGVDLATAAKLCGHASVSTTAAYDRRPETAKRAAAELLHVPYRAPTGGA